MNINQRLAEELKIELWQVEAAVKLIDEGIRFRLFHVIVRRSQDR